MRKFLIKILFRLLKNNETYRGIDDEAINSFLANIYQEPGFHEWFRKRDLQILKTLATGVGEENYYILLGERYALLTLAQDAKRAFEEEKKKRFQKSKRVRHRKD